MSTDPLDCSLDLLRRLPPMKIKQNLAKLIQLQPDLAEDLLSSVDQPLGVATCKKTGKDFLVCDYNRDGVFYRSPWSGEYQAQTLAKAPTNPYKPSAGLVALEAQFNEAFAVYKELYFSGGISSVYLWDLDGGFAGAILIKKTCPAEGQCSGANWDSTHVVQVSPLKKIVAYKLTSTVMMGVGAGAGQTAANLAGSLTRQAEQDCILDASTSHIVNVGRMVEEMENKMRATINEIYFGKTCNILNDLRVIDGLKVVRGRGAVQAQLAESLKNSAKK